MEQIDFDIQHRPELRILNNCMGTVKAYMCALRTLVRHCHLYHVREFNQADLKHYPLYLLEAKTLAGGMTDQMVSILRFLSAMLYQRPVELRDHPRPKRSRTLPTVLVTQEIEAFFAAAIDHKDRTLLMPPLCARTACR